MLSPMQSCCLYYALCIVIIYVDFEKRSRVSQPDRSTLSTQSVKIKVERNRIAIESTNEVKLKSELCVSMFHRNVQPAPCT